MTHTGSRSLPLTPHPEPMERTHLCTDCSAHPPLHSPSSQTQVSSEERTFPDCDIKMLPERTQTALGVRGTWRILTPYPKTGLELAKRPKGLGRKAQTCRRNAARPCSKEGLGKAACGQILKNLGPEWQPSSSQAGKGQPDSEGEQIPGSGLASPCAQRHPATVLLWVLPRPLGVLCPSQLLTYHCLQTTASSPITSCTRNTSPSPTSNASLKQSNLFPPGPELQRCTQAFDSRLLL